MRRFTLFVVLVAFTVSCGGQWPVLQCIAWANMIREYSEMVPMTEAVQMTFSGHYPCALCKAIAEKKNSEQQKSFVLAKYDKKFLTSIAVCSFRLQSSEIVYFETTGSLRFRSDAPSVPPPRTALI